jgi:GTP-binding protein Era
MQTTQAFRSGFVAIVGAPNVGKSTLLNALLGTKLAIVSPKPQTTRQHILGIKHLPQAQLVFVDTPGIHQPQTKLERYMMQEVTEALASPDVVLYMTDASRAPYPDLAFLQRHLRDQTAHVFWVLNKIDVVTPQKALPLIAAYAEKQFFAEIFPLSALHGDNIAALVESLVQYLPEGPQYFPAQTLTASPEHVRIAELIREQVLLHTHEEVPYAVAVEVEAMHERRDGSVEIQASILVEKASQKGILVGRQGRMIKTIGMQARSAMRDLLHRPVHLRLFVRVEKRWKERDAVLRELGFGGL